jgi:hypothetical protein
VDTGHFPLPPLLPWVLHDVDQHQQRPEATRSDQQRPSEHAAAATNSRRVTRYREITEASNLTLTLTLTLTRTRTLTRTKTRRRTQTQTQTPTRFRIHETRVRLPASACLRTLAGTSRSPCIAGARTASPPRAEEAGGPSWTAGSGRSSRGGGCRCWGWSGSRPVGQVWEWETIRGVTRRVTVWCGMVICGVVG